MRGHVDHVAFTRHEAREPLGARHGGLGVHRLDGVDVVVAGPGMVRVAGDDSPELADDLRGALVGRAVRPPVVPRAEVHQGFGIQGRGVQVVRIGLGHLGHRARVGGVEPRAVGGRGRLVALRDRLDVRALPRRGVGLEGKRLLRRGVRRDTARRVHGRVDVRPVGKRDAPVAHGAGGIELHGAGERADRLPVVEAVGESQALVEVLLRGRDAGGDALVVGAEVGVEGDGVGGGDAGGGDAGGGDAGGGGRGAGIGEHGGSGEYDRLRERH